MRKGTKIVVFLAALVLVIAAALCLPGWLRSYAVNTPDRETGADVPAVLSLYSREDIGFSFLFPSGMPTGWDDADGAALYAGEPGSAPYVLVHRTDKRGMSPKKYFKKCDAFMLDTFSSVQSTPIQEVPLGEKTLYLTRYVCSGGGADYVIDRMVELYKSFYIEYTAVSGEADSLDTALYYAASTLRVKDGAYAGAYSKKTTRFIHAETGMSIELPDMFVTNDLTIGCFSSDENAVMLCVLCTEDDEHVPIYNRRDFMDRAAADPDFVANRLGADSTEFGEGQEETLGGRNFYCYPMKMALGAEIFNGTLCLANADETGCWLLCYAVRENAPAEDLLSALCQSCAESISFK